MRRFHFTLRPVAVIRAHEDLRAREAFALAIHAYVKAEEALALRRQKIAKLEGILFSKREGRFRPEEAAGFFRAYRLERQDELKVEREVVEARDKMQKRRSEYLEAHRKLEVVSRLEEKARLRYRAEALRIEQAQIDEFAGHAVARNSVLT